MDLSSILNTVLLVYIGNTYGYEDFKAGTAAIVIICLLSTNKYIIRIRLLGRNYKPPPFSPVFCSFFCISYSRKSSVFPYSVCPPLSRPSSGPLSVWLSIVVIRPIRSSNLHTRRAQLILILFQL